MVERWRARLAWSHAYNLVALLDGRPAGMAGGIARGDGTSELRSVWVSPETRGCGVGDRLVAAVEGWARQRGSRALRLCVIPGNEAAIALCLRNGFALAPEPGDLLPDGRTRELVMVKPLQ